MNREQTRRESGIGVSNVYERKKRGSAQVCVDTKGEESEEFERPKCQRAKQRRVDTKEED